MSTFPAQTSTISPLHSPDEEVKGLRLAVKEAQWWALWPGDPGYGTPLHEYLGFTEPEWRDYAISSRRVR
jgi:hypothetical protein